jgi:hypothetical protein
VGLPPKQDNDGPSLVPLLRDVDADWPHVSLTHLAEPGSYGLSGERWRYIHYANGDEELYDCQTDPHEWTNLATASEQSARLKRLRRLAPQTFAPLVPPKDESLPKLKWHPADEESAPPSKPDGGTFEVVFFNLRSTPVNLFWMDRQGEPKSYGTIAAGERQRQRTRPGAVWLVTDVEGRRLGHFIVDDRRAQARIPEKE